MKNVFILILFVFFSKNAICQVTPIGSAYPINQNLGRNASTLVSTNNIRFDQGMILGHFTDTTVANALPYLKNYPYTIISVDTNIVYMRNWNATKWMYMPVEGQVVNGDTIHYLIRVNRRPGSDSVFGKYYNGVTTFESFQFIDSTGGSAITASNGLTKVGDDIRLFGSLTQNTIINNSIASGTFLFQNVGINRIFTVSSKAATSSTDSTFIRVRRSGSLNIAEMEQVTGAEKYNVKVGISAVDLFYDSASSRNNLLEILREGFRFNSRSDAVESRKSQFLIYPDSIIVNPDRGTLRIDSINYTLSTTGKKILIRDTATGLVQNIDPALITGVNIYNSDGTLTGNRTVSGGGNDFSMTGLGDYDITTTAPGRVSIGTTSGSTSSFFSTNGGTNQITMEANTSGVASSQISALPSIIQINPNLGNFVIDTLANISTQNQLMGWTSTSGGDRGEVGYVTIGSGLSLSGGQLSATGGGVALSDITAATGSNSIDNGNFTQVWNWGTLNGSGLILSSDATTATSVNQKVLQVTNEGANSNSSATTYGIHANNTKTGTSSTNIAGYFAASGGTNNYALQLVDGSQGSGKVLTSDANGNATWETPSAVSPAGNFGNIQINRNGAFATPGSDSLDFEATTGLVSLAGGFSITGENAKIYGNGGLGGIIMRYGAGDANAVVVQTGSIAMATTFGTRMTIVDASTTVSNRLRQTQGADVASAAGSIALGSDGNTFEITGTAAITLISNVSWQNGSEVTLFFTSTATLTDGTANSGTDIGMELFGNVNFIATAGASLTLVLAEIGGTQRWREKCRSVN